jgi:hypothetical protein
MIVRIEEWIGMWSNQCSWQRLVVIVYKKQLFAARCSGLLVYGTEVHGFAVQRAVG